MVEISTNTPLSPDVQSGYCLTLKAELAGHAGHAGLTSHDIASLRPEIIGQWAMDQLQAKFGSHFEITGTPGDTLTLAGLPELAGVGAHMSRGTLVIQGSVGDDLGAAMTGGTIHVHGSAGDRIGGPASEQFNEALKLTEQLTEQQADHDSGAKQKSGNRTGAVGRRGMNGGTIVVHGNAGDYAGLHMRRGLIAITGHARKSPGYRMIAGTVVVGRGDLNEPGLEMQRGTIVSLSPEAAVHAEPYFETDGVFEAQGLSVIGLMLTQLGKLGFDITSAMRDGQWRLSSGDRHELGKGELWQWTH